MKQPIIFDIETDGLNPSKVHCLVLQKDGKEISFIGRDIPKGIDLLADNLIVGHNVIKYDLPVLKRLYSYDHSPDLVHDTLCLSRLIYPDIANSVDYKLLASDRIERSTVGRHSLKAWGQRLNFHKGDFAEINTFDTFTPAMLEYCIQDVKLTSLLYTKLLEKGFSKESIELEHEIANILKLQEDKGFGFDELKAQQLHATLLGRTHDLKLSLENRFPDWQVDLGEFVPKVNNKKLGYKKGVAIRKSKTMKFNPSSRQHISNRLMELRNWKPKKFSETGLPIVDEETLDHLDYPEAKELNEYLLIEKRLGMLSDGKNAWLKVVNKGRIHSNYITNITTGRMSCRSPNLQQVPSINSPYGKECRELFIPSKGYVMVGADASGIEARSLGHYIYNYTGGKEYVDLILNGDIHTYNQKNLGLKSRALAKTILYAVLYGASARRVHEILDCSMSEANKVLEKFYRVLPFLQEIKEDIIGKLEAFGYIKGIDKRILTIRSQHSALNALNQSCAAIIMKKALTILWDKLKDKDAFVVANIHDEFQIEAKPEIADEVGKIAVDSIVQAGEHFNLRVPLGAEYRVGKSWAETH
jgi:DNA polymerase I-like protein with 3'-5' exonuclease and polymerase domains